MKILENVLKLLKNPKTYITLVVLFYGVTKLPLESYTTWAGLGEALKIFISNPVLILLFLYELYENFYTKGIGE